ncbi:low temperature requirement protein A [Streptomyces sp. 2A115]|uniref:low temperature requirement protein A n=1 Tax=Streptomyces sp. 2A115 TaxID=3457439 RepID=UPI003FCFA636
MRLALPVDGGTATFAVLAGLELAVPVWAEGTTWHPQHIAERYGLFTLIVLGESVMAAGLAVGTALNTHKNLGSILPIALGGLLTVFALWWMYFAQVAPRRLRTQRTAMLWGYGHYVVFAAAAVCTVPVTLFVTCVWLLHRRAAQVVHGGQRSSACRGSGRPLLDGHPLPRTGHRHHRIPAHRGPARPRAARRFRRLRAPCVGRSALSTLPRSVNSAR